jgi:hypothetical protein
VVLYGQTLNRVMTSISLKDQIIDKKKDRKGD